MDVVDGIFSETSDEVSIVTVDAWATRNSFGDKGDGMVNQNVKSA